MRRPQPRSTLPCTLVSFTALCLSDVRSEDPGFDQQLGVHVNLKRPEGKVLFVVFVESRHIVQRSLTEKDPDKPQVFRCWKARKIGLPGDRVPRSDARTLAAITVRPVMIRDRKSVV